MTRILTPLLFLMLSAPLLAQDTNTAWPEHAQPIADWISTGAAVTTMTADVVHAYQEKHWTGIGCEAVKFGLVNLQTTLLKHWYPEERPNKKDFNSCCSQHSANAMAATGWQWQWSYSIAVGTGYLRTAANMHWWHDVIAGWLIGLESKWATQLIPACR